MLSEDLWLYIAQTYLVKEDVSRLSRTYHFIHEGTLPVVFQDLCVTGFASHQVLLRLQNLSEKFEWLEKRLTVSSDNPRISASVRMVTLRKLVVCPSTV